MELLRDLTLDDAQSEQFCPTGSFFGNARVDTHVLMTRRYLLYLFNWCVMHEIAKDLPSEFFSLVSPALKLGHFQDAIKKKSSSTSPSLWINRKASFDIRVGQQQDLSQTIIAQLADAYSKDRPSNYRNASSRPWHVSFSGERGTDAGGLARDLMSEACADLRAVRCGLMIPVPNAAASFDENKDCLIPIASPAIKNPASQYHMVGVLIGMCIRTGLVQPFMFPDFVWDYLVDGKLAIESIFKIDRSYASLIHSLQDALDSRMTNEEFGQKFRQNFCVMNSLGERVPLCINGENTPITPENCASYLALAKEFRLKEIEGNLSEMRKGLWENLAIDVPWTLDGATLEVGACGDKDVSIAALKKITKFQGIDQEDQNMLWRVLSSFTSQQRSAYLKFVSGRVRLPAHEVNKIELKVDCGRETDQLPTASTCFHALHLPHYTSFETARRMILIAIEYCGTIENC